LLVFLLIEMMTLPSRFSTLWIGLAALIVAAGTGVYLQAHRLNSVHRDDYSPSPPVQEPALEPPLSTGMDEAQREYLWEIEHHGNVLSRGPEGFRALGEALAHANQKKLRGLLADDFEAQTLGPGSEEVRTSNQMINVVRQQPGTAPPKALSADQFVNQMMEWRALFSVLPKVQIALMGLRPLDRNKMDGPWQGSCQLRMFGETAPGKPGEVTLYLTYRIAQPTEKSLPAGRWIHFVSVDQIQVARADHFLMHEVAAKRGIDVDRFHDNWKRNRPFMTNTGGVYLCDFDRDGILDMLIVDTKDIVLYQGQSDGSFRDVTASMNLPTSFLNRHWPSPACSAFVDLDGDGWEDLILGGRIYRNDRGKRFIDVTDLSNLRLSPEASGLAIADYDRDGKVDLYAAQPGQGNSKSWLSGTSGQDTGGNQLWRNLGNFRFENVTARSNTAAGNRSCFTALWLDANNDGWPDLYVINEFGNGVLLVNQQNGTFKEVQLGKGPYDFGTMGATCGDIDNDGNIDIYCGNMYSKAGSRIIGNVLPSSYPEDVMHKMRTFVAGSQLWRNEGELKFEPIGKKLQVNAVGWAYGPAFVDLDNDGWLDLFATCGFVSQSRTEPDG
jgi:hypothetical protein